VEALEGLRSWALSAEEVADCRPMQTSQAAWALVWRWQADSARQTFAPTTALQLIDWEALRSDDGRGDEWAAAGAIIEPRY